MYVYASFVGYVLSADLILTGSDQRATETQLLTIGVVVSSVSISTCVVSVFLSLRSLLSRGTLLLPLTALRWSRVECLLR